MKEALYYEKVKGNKVKCCLCPHSCIILDEERGFCRVRENNKGKIYSLVYGKPCSTAIDPIEKKPLYHFIPGHKSFSIATVGCNFRCMHCQNSEISQPKEIYGEELTPERVVELAIDNDCKSIAYTYTEPTVFYEYAHDIMKLARKKGIKNVIVSNGYINEEPLKGWCKYLDAANIDLKAFDDGFYKKICSARLEPVLNSLQILKEKNIWLENTNLVIPGLNDDFKKIKEMCLWIKDNLGEGVPIHFSAFMPHYKLNNVVPTPESALLKAREIALKSGLNYVYVGNVVTEEGNNTYCPKCGKLLIERCGFGVNQNNMKNGKCGCGKEILGVWK